ncbi:hypothetical protein MrNuV_ORF059 [Macrobrachium rosenbergii nudivirus]|nr:hypothetical protein MrNuV_ORF059 [Macrobrachium rosenbergii nudivirus]
MTDKQIIITLSTDDSSDSESDSSDCESSSTNSDSSSESIVFTNKIEKHVRFNITKTIVHTYQQTSCDNLSYKMEDQIRFKDRIARFNIEFKKIIKINK